MTCTPATTAKPNGPPSGQPPNAAHPQWNTAVTDDEVLLQAQHRLGLADLTEAEKEALIQAHRIAAAILDQNT